MFFSLAWPKDLPLSLISASESRPSTHLYGRRVLLDRRDPLLYGIRAVGHGEVTPLVTLGVQRLGMKRRDLEANRGIRDTGVRMQV